MRILLALVFFALATPAFAQGWSQYDNARFGYSGAIPPDFSGYGESDNGDGQIYDNAGTMQVLSYWGSALVEPNFEAEVRASMGYAERDGWNMASQIVTPEWAGFSGIMGKQHFYRHMILLCDGTSAASFTLQYSAKDAADMRAVIDRLTTSFYKGKC